MALRCEPREFSSRKAFIDWIRDAIAVNKRSPTPECALFIQYNPFTSRLTASIDRSDRAPKEACYVFDIPTTLKQASAIWNKLQYRHDCIFMTASMFTYDIVVAIRRGIWDQCDNRLLPTHKEEFDIINDDEFEAVLKDRQKLKEMLLELYVFGISCRVVLHGDESNPGKTGP